MLLQETSSTPGHPHKSVGVFETQEYRETEEEGGVCAEESGKGVSALEGKGAPGEMELHCGGNNRQFNYYLLLHSILK
jgi:hypothetical protein